MGEHQGEHQQRCAGVNHGVGKEAVAPREIVEDPTPTDEAEQRADDAERPEQRIHRHETLRGDDFGQKRRARRCKHQVENGGDEGRRVERVDGVRAIVEKRHGHEQQGADHARRHDGAGLVPAIDERAEERSEDQDRHLGKERELQELEARSRHEQPEHSNQRELLEPVAEERDELDGTEELERRFTAHGRGAS
jgi:hypothetical protein